MGRIGNVLLLTLLLAGAVSCDCIRPPRVANAQAAIPYQQVEIGLCEDYPKSARSMESARHDFALLRAHHIRVLRIAFPWDSIEPKPGGYDWSFWDEFVRTATDEFGIRLIPYVCYTPQWSSTGTATNFWRCPPRDNGEFAAFVRTIVTRYRDRIHSWEIWNEPDNPEYWEGSVSQFAELFKAGSRAVRQADPGAKVVLGGIAWNLEFLRALFEWRHASPAADIVNLHCYYETWSADPIEDIGRHVRRAESIIREFGDHQPIWLAEIGYSNYRRGGYVSPAYRASFSYEHTAEFQAQTLGRAMASALATGKVRLIAWYRIHDLPPTTRVIGDENNRRLGVLDESGRPKPVLRSLDFFHALFAGSFRCLDSTTLQIRTILSDCEAHVFQKSDGGEFVTSWLRTIGWNAGPTGTADLRHGDMELILNAKDCGRMTAYDEFGADKSCAPLRKCKGGGRELAIRLRAGELRVYDCRAPSTQSSCPSQNN